MTIKEITNKINEKLFFKWLAYNIVIIIVSVLMFIIAFYISQQIIQEQISKAHLASLNQIKYIVDSQLRNTDKLFREFELIGQVRELMFYNEDYRPRHILSMVEIQKVLKTYKVLNENIFDCYVYFSGQDSVLCDTGKYKPDMFYEFIHPYTGLSYADWYEIISSEKYKIYYSTEVKANQSLKPIVLIGQSISAYSENSAKLVVCLDGHFINRVIENAKWIDNCSIVALDENNDIVFNPLDANIPDNLSYSGMRWEDNIFYYDINGEESVIIHTKSEVNGWRYVSIVPKSFFFNEAYKTARIIFVIFILGVLLISAIAYYSALKNYIPIKKIIQFIDSSFGSRYSLNTYELAKIENALYGITEENKQMNRKIFSQNALMKKYYFARLLKGEVYGQVVEGTSQEYNLEFTAPGYVVLIISIEDASKSIFRAGQAKAKDCDEKISFIIDNVFTELLSEKYIVEKTFTDNLHVFILNMDEDRLENYKAELKNIFKKAGNFIEDNFQVSITACASSYHIGLSSLCDCYNEAFSLYNMELIEDGEGIQFYDKTESRYGSGNHLDIFELEAKFIHYFSSKSFDKARECLKDIYNICFLNEAVSQNLKICREYVIINTLLTSIERLDEQQGIDLFERLNPDGRLFKCKKTNELYEEAIKLINEAEVLFCAEGSVNSTQEICRQAISIINENITDINLNVSSVAYKLGVSVSYISRYFKKHIGVGPLDYMHSIRIGKAKELLACGNRNLNEIANSVGYANSLSLIRVFKKYEGITPGKLNHKG